jgi:hypothetical protein
MRGKMALEVEAEIYSRHMFLLANVATLSMKPSSKEEQFPPPWRPPPVDENT